MPLNNPPLKDRPEILADWVELRTLADSSGSFRLSLLKRFWDTRRETESTDVEGRAADEKNTDEDGVSGGDEEKFLDAVTDELGERADQLGDAYPFQFKNSGNRFELKPDLSIGASTYLFCLLFEHHKVGDLWTGAWLPSINNATRDIFQICSTLAAAGKLQGCAVSFGWPRPDQNPSFLEKLKEVYALFGEGSPRDQPPPGASPWVKDEEVDVIAWQPRPDKTAGTIYLLGQVASGDNWFTKPIKGGPIDYFHQTWFSTIPPSTPAPAIFIPHAVPPVGEGNRRERMAVLTARFGIIFDRMLLPSMTQAGYVLGQKQLSGIHIERMDERAKISNWVTTQIASLRGVGGAPL